MKTQFSQNKYLTGSLLIFVGLALGWLFFHHPGETGTEKKTTVTSTKKQIWTCSMHPQIKLDHPGKCPICGMDLIPFEEHTQPVDSNAVVIDQSAMQLANIQTSVVGIGNPSKEVRLQGEIEADERRIQTQPAHIPGRIEKLLVSFTGEPIRRGQVIAQVYAPDLINAQQELLEAMKYKSTNPELIEAAEDKLRSWKITNAQIRGIEKSNVVKELFTIKATSSGTVIRKLVNLGDYVTRGQALYEVADFSSVWVMLNAYETDLPWIKRGQSVRFTVQSIPDHEFEGKVSFIDPLVDPQKRTARIRIEMPNSSGKLKPGMFVTAQLQALPERKNMLIVPRTSVLWTGRASYVYVKDKNSQFPAFVCRQVKLGPLSGEWYIIQSGLQSGEEIVTNGAFAVDAAAQLAGKPSMMNPVLPQKMKMNASAGSENNVSSKNKLVNEKFRAQLGNTLPAYLILVEDFILSDPAKVSKQAEILLHSLNQVNTALLDKNTDADWISDIKMMKKHLTKITKTKKIEQQRTIFVSFNEDYFKMVKSVGLKHTTLYRQYCPMADSNKGGYWISNKKPIRNPYMGEKMLNCGETKETIKH
ncbi:MAG: efflux RND transporter periplasmic adaptor subunit [Bacteroidota bacterium]|nr:efflux RND transporter periplasmic adaptor subunit [Bacteroidota bacterium]